MLWTLMTVLQRNCIMLRYYVQTRMLIVFNPPLHRSPNETLLARILFSPILHTLHSMPLRSLRRIVTSHKRPINLTEAL